MENALDLEWVELMLEAKKLGMSCEEVRNYINRALEQQENGKMEDFFA
ncbi:hypothetical protein DCC39_15140 [Pueribacillus theae]|uniref:Sin domain-containing protein n=1 Tax=Pueribacillus theae TaxID=2171751 RepID=A0A2U1JTV3_9BACI|nr:anti-repressor SinI family protein [Pueribacillus theae]PWA08268.1 hypothetical protein DCC39_15140 [Pueribacillus theae]